MRSERRVLVILVVLVAVAAPAAVLRALCLGSSCADEAEVRRSVPFCSLPPELRDRIAAGYREGRSPDILAVTRSEFPLAGGGRYDAAPWPSLGAEQPRLPLLFYGRGVSRGVTIPAGTGLDDISPTIAAIIGFDIPHPEVRSGRPIDGLASGERPRLVVIALVHGDEDSLAGVIERFGADGATTPSVDSGSLPLDRAAVTATIGTGGLPYQHGVTGSLVRNDEGRLVKSWGKDFPGTVIATLSDDLDEELRQKPKIGLVANDPRDRGLVGGNWYVDTDQDELAIADPPRATVPRTRSMMAEGFGDDAIPDVLAVTVARDAGDTVARVWRSAVRASQGSALLVVTALPPDAPKEQGPKGIAHQIDRVVGAPVIERAVSGGFFLDQDALARERLTKDEVVASIRQIEATDGDPLFADVFPGIAVSLGEFC